MFWCTILLLSRKYVSVKLSLVSNKVFSVTRRMIVTRLFENVSRDMLRLLRHFYCHHGRRNFIAWLPIAWIKFYNIFVGLSWDSITFQSGNIQVISDIPFSSVKLLLCIEFNHYRNSHSSICCSKGISPLFMVPLTILFNQFAL